MEILDPSLDCIPPYVRRCANYFIFIIALVIVCSGLMLTQGADMLGKYIVVTGVVLFMIGMLMVSHTSKSREPHPAEMLLMETRPSEDPPPLYNDAWRESYMKDQMEKAELDPPPPSYKESWSKGLWKTYYKSGRKDCDNSVSTLFQDVETVTSPSIMNNASRCPYVLHEYEYLPQISPTGNSSCGERPPSSPSSLQNSTPDLECVKSSTAPVSAVDFAERLRRHSSATQLQSSYSPPSQESDSSESERIGVSVTVDLPSSGDERLLIGRQPSPF